jgi:hypothetical protein
MNEQIKQLAEQAEMAANKGDHVDVKIMMAKFAELIVRECVKSALSLRDTAIDNQWNLDETFHVIVDTIVEDLNMQHIFRS